MSVSCDTDPLCAASTQECFCITSVGLQQCFLFHIRNYHNDSDLKQHAVIISHFHRSKVQAQLSLIPCRGSHKAAVKMPARVPCQLEAQKRKNVIPSSIRLLAVSHSCTADTWFYSLLTRGSPQFSRVFQHDNLLHQAINWISLLLQSVTTESYIIRCNYRGNNLSPLPYYVT